MQKIIFISDKKHLDSEIPGGVQICTKEYSTMLENAGFQIIYFPIKHTRNIFTRIKMKLGIELYTRYNFKEYINEIIQIAESQKISIIALNQVDLMGFAPLIKSKLKCKIVILSHGNESGDFLHKITRSKYNKFLKIRDIIRLGFTIYKESYNFIHYIDCVFSVSHTEKEINNWLGVSKAIYIPRTYKKQLLNWNPVMGRVGFVGTLNHMPNIDGLYMLLDELSKIQNKSIEVRIVGGPKNIGIEIEEKYSFVKYVGFIDDNQLIEEASTWSLFVNPIFWYSRGVTTKLAMAINWGIPFISTGPGNRGYKFSETKPVITETPQEMAELILRVCSQKEEIEKLSVISRKILDEGPTFESFNASIWKVLN